ncbi:hypothetical protein ACIQZG_10535 [Lysinibacillus sp. NPDC096418]|uniref:hypothetical protein n=1 Tax=Lysinibacillus sp. NPDC096418 TaxID=3364138 RepID=UPI00382057C6
MDPYNHKKHARRPSKKRSTHLKIVETTVKTVCDEATILEVVVVEEPNIPSESKTQHTAVLHKQTIKVIAMFLAFFISILLTIPFVTLGHPIVISGPFEKVKFYIIIAIVLGLSLSLPFFIFLMWTIIKTRLK